MAGIVPVTKTESDIMNRTALLAITWAVSKGRDTYGYNICRLDSPVRRYRTCGGGYDMIGTVVGDWLNAEFQERLQQLAAFAHASWDTATKTRSTSQEPGAFYGLTATYKNGVLQRATIDGACGIESVIRIARAAGIDLERVASRKGATTGFWATWAD